MGCRQICKFLLVVEEPGRQTSLAPNLYCGCCSRWGDVQNLYLPCFPYVIKKQRGCREINQIIVKMKCSSYPAHVLSAMCRRLFIKFWVFEDEEQGWQLYTVTLPCIVKWDGDVLQNNKLEYIGRCISEVNKSQYIFASKHSVVFINCSSAHNLFFFTYQTTSFHRP